LSSGGPLRGIKLGPLGDGLGSAHDEGGDGRYGRYEYGEYGEGGDDRREYGKDGEGARQSRTTFEIFINLLGQSS